MKFQNANKGELTCSSYDENNCWIGNECIPYNDPVTGCYNQCPTLFCPPDHMECPGGIGKAKF